MVILWGVEAAGLEACRDEVGVMGLPPLLMGLEDILGQLSMQQRLLLRRHVAGSPEPGLTLFGLGLPLCERVVHDPGQSGIIEHGVVPGVIEKRIHGNGELTPDSLGCVPADHTDFDRDFA